MHSRALILLNISGIKDGVIWLGFILFDFGYCIFAALFFSITEYTHKKVFQTGVSFGMLFLFFIFSSLAMYTSGVFMAPFFNRFGRFGLFILLYILLTTYGWFLPSVIQSNPKTNCIFLPSAVVHNFYQNLLLNIQNEIPMSFKNPGMHQLFTTNQLIGFLFFQIFFYSFLFMISVLFAPKQWGLPPLGINNLFKKVAWKRLFHLSKFFDFEESEKFLSVKDLTKIYTGEKNIVAVNNANFDIKKGEVILLIGPNGSGKTTLLQSLTGAIPVNSGSLEIFGNEASFLDLQRCTGYCYQDNLFFDYLSVREHLVFFARLRGVKKSEIKEKIDQMASFLDISDILDRNPNKLSAGQKRCVSTAMAFIGSPSFVILDEPTVGVDVKKRQLVWSIASYFRNTTTIIASHSLEEGEAVVSRLFVMEKGIIKFQGTSSDLRQQYKCGYRLHVICKEDEKDYDKVISDVLEMTKLDIPDAVIDFERGDCIMLPVCNQIPALLKRLDKDIKSTNAEGYTISVENLEHVMLRMIADGDEY
ncbi:ABC transporter family protein [Trichomonas vaginalis G3]|uniref:ABC transporter family protein n=1 Tax=Trichomonas vaginalis (strain ATCC PRA-98 / G3) TaxID=412133 RepID=A2FE71_TRIV3|nr:ATPase activity, coupled to transmembrane movement of substances [Trichomonas vaginalis G3]EAX96800.1 ABC transporter family protein [Trichomonas vaginalis G3]KAI5509587.1 ATPase activity, coupled to transmembrane movement of substances [Trichomonas vaginalis G3]|eukprot:XP_001309730.1 ABC transporter family protein [Trichomonas vaginalis G3]